MARLSRFCILPTPNPLRAFLFHYVNYSASILTLPPNLHLIFLSLLPANPRVAAWPTTRCPIVSGIQNLRSGRGWLDAPEAGDERVARYYRCSIFRRQAPLRHSDPRVARGTREIHSQTSDAVDEFIRSPRQPLGILDMFHQPLITTYSRTRRRELMAPSPWIDAGLERTWWFRNCSWISDKWFQPFVDEKRS